MNRKQHRTFSINVRTTEDVRRMLDFLTVRDGRSQGQIIDRALHLLLQTWPTAHDRHSCEMPDGCGCGCHACERLIAAGIHKRLPAGTPISRGRRVSLTEMVKQASAAHG